MNETEWHRRIGSIRFAATHIFFKANVALSNIKSRNNLDIMNARTENPEIKIVDNVAHINLSHRKSTPKFKRKRASVKAIDFHTISTNSLKSYYEAHCEKNKPSSLVKHKVVRKVCPLDISREENIENNRTVLYSRLHSFADVKTGCKSQYILELSVDKTRFYIVSINLSDNRLVQTLRFYKKQGERMVSNAGGLTEFIDCVDFQYGKMVVRSLNDLLYDTDTTFASKKDLPKIKTIHELDENLGATEKYARAYQSVSPYRMANSFDDKNNNSVLIDRLCSDQLSF